jgi:hypothetical protein
MLSVYKLEHKLTLCSEFGISEGVSAASAAGMRTVVVPSISDLSAYPDPSPGNASGKSIWGEGSWATLFMYELANSGPVFAVQKSLK